MRLRTTRRCTRHGSSGCAPAALQCRLCGARTTRFFIPAGAGPFRTDVPDAQVVLLDTGHFALEEEVDTIAGLVRTFLARLQLVRTA